MEARQRLDRLQLHDDRVLNQQIEPISAFKTQLSVGDGQADLASDLQPPGLELMSKADLVGGFQQAGPKRPVDRESSVDDLSRNRVDRPINALVLLVSLVVQLGVPGSRAAIAARKPGRRNQS